MSQQSHQQQQSDQSHGGQQVSLCFQQAAPKKSRIRSLRVKVALLGTVSLLVAAIISSCGGSTAPKQAPLPNIYVGGLTEGLTLNTDTSNHQQGWLTEHGGVLTLIYPAGQEWGAMFITKGRSVSLSDQRQSLDLSTYQSLEVDMRAATNGQCVRIGIKGTKQPDKGGETTIPWCSTTPNRWDIVKLPLEVFTRTDLTDFPADLTKLYVVFEVVFQGSSNVTVQVRNIRYTPI
jgi:hypothetical protein